MQLKTRLTIIIAIFAISLVMVSCQNNKYPKQISDADIKKMLVDHVDKLKKSKGIVVGIVKRDGTHIISYGKKNDGRDDEVNGDTIFELGSVTKIFTSVILADMYNNGEINVNDTISKYLPSFVKTPNRNGKEITLLTLANHSSGLPRMPTNFSPKDKLNPYSDYSVDDLYSFLSNYELKRNVGETFEYSNVGYGLLGHILALRANQDYETMILSRICIPLGMESTRINLTSEMKERLASGHDQKLKPVPNWDIKTLEGAGALRSSMNDLLKFVSANMGMGNYPISRSLEITQIPTHSKGMSDTKIGFDWSIVTTKGISDSKIGLGWNITTTKDKEIIWKNGSTGGYYSLIAFDSNKKIGIVILSNSSNPTNDIGSYILLNKY